MADFKTTNIYGDIYINNKVGINTNSPATRLQIGQLTPTSVTEGLQFGDDPGTRIYRSAAGTLTLSGSVAGLTLSASTALNGNYGDWSGEVNKIQWHSNNLYFVNRGGGSWIFRNSAGSNVFSVSAAGHIDALSIQTTNDGPSLRMAGSTNAEGIRMQAVSSSTYPVFLKSINPGSGGESSPWIYRENSPDWGIWHNNPVNSIDFTKQGSGGIVNNVGGSSTNTVTVRVEMDSGYVQTIGGYKNSTGTTILNNSGNITGTSTNITAYTINQNVGSTDSPTFAAIRLTTGNINRPDGAGVALNLGNGTNSHYGAQVFYNTVGNTELARMTNIGTVGIGTSNPAGVLEVQGTTDASLGAMGLQTQLWVTDNRNQTTGVGGGITFGSEYINGSAAQTTLALIRGSKDNSSSTNTAGNLEFYASSGSFKFHSAINGLIGANAVLMTLDNTGRLGLGTSDFSYTTNDNTRLVGSNTSNKMFITGSLQFLNSNDAIVFGRSTATFLTDEELGFGWGGGWYMTDTTYLRVRNNKAIYSTGEIRASQFTDSQDPNFYVYPSGASILKYEEGQNQYSFRGANRAIDDWEYSGLSINPTYNDYGDGSWYIDAGTSNNWDRGILSKRRFRRVEGLTLEYETYTQANVGSDVYVMIGFVGGNSTSYNYSQTPANLTYQDNGGLSVYTNGSASGTDYSFDTRGAWWRFKTVLKGTGALHYVYRNSKWNLIKETSINNQNDYEYLRVLFSLFRQRVYIRDMKVYVAQQSFRGTNYIDNIAGGLITSGTVAAGVGGKLSFIGLDINSGGTPTYIKIITTIPSNSPSADFTVNIKGFAYGSQAATDLSICWHWYTSTFYNATAKSSGGWAPTIRLSAESGFVAIVLTAGVYWPKLYVESMYSSAYSSSYASGWSWVDADATGSPIVTVAYRSHFGNNFIMYGDGTVTVKGTDNNSGKADLSVDSGGTATMALSGQYFRVGNNDVNWNVKIQSDGYFATWAQSMRFSTDSGANPITFATNGTERMRIDGTGLVGIGTTVPSSPLHVYSSDSRYLTFSSTGQLTLQRNVLSTNAATPQLTIINTQGSDSGTGRGVGIQLDLGYGGSASTVGTAARGARIATLNETAYSATATDQNASLVFFTSTAGTNTEKVRITSGGNVGIGTSSPAASLHIISSTAGATLLRTDGTNGTLFSVVDDLSDSLMSVNNSAGLPVFEVFADDRIVGGQYGKNDFVLINNKVGIGTNNPANKLTVSGSVSIGESYINTSAPTNGLIVQGNVGIGTTSITDGARLNISGETRIVSSTAYFTHLNYLDGGNNIISSANNGSTVFRGSSNNITAMTILGTGNVGIGTTLPQALLHVNGLISGSSFSGAGTGLTGTAANLSIGGSAGSCTGNAATATILQTARNIGGVSFNGSADINLPGVNTAGNQNTSGNAATATAATTARRIDDASRTAFTVGGNKDNYYPVIFNIGSGATALQYSEFVIERGGYEEPGYTFAGGNTFSTLNIRFSCKSNGWGYGASYENVEMHGYTTQLVANWEQMSEASKLIVWLRGATIYYFWNVVANTTLHDGNSGGTSLTLAQAPYYSYTYTSTATVQAKAQYGKYVNSSTGIPGLYVAGRILAEGFFSGPGTGLTGTAANLTAGAANSVAWTNVSGRPTNVSTFTNDSGYLTSVINITGNAGTVTNGVYTTGNQTIAGNKTFTGTSTITGSIESVAVRETFAAVTTNTTVSIDLSTATVFNLSFTGTISAFNITNVNTARVNSFTLISAPGAGAATIAWSFQTNSGAAANVKWAGSAPTATTTTNRWDVFSFVYNGSAWYGFTGGLNYV